MDGFGGINGYRSGVTPEAEAPDIEMDRKRMENTRMINNILKGLQENEEWKKAVERADEEKAQEEEAP